MINGDVKEFIDGLYYGDERFFTFKGCKYFLQGEYSGAAEPPFRICEYRKSGTAYR